MPAHLLPFLGVVAVLTVTPGPDMALVLRNGVRGGTRAAWWTGLGCSTGIAIHATAAVAGLSALLVASATAFAVVKIAGAAYLVFLGVSALWHAGRPAPALERPAADETETDPTEAGTAYRQGLVSNLLNPKIALLFLTLIPQFVSPDEPAFTTTALLAGTFLAVSIVWWRVFSLGVGVLGRVLARRRVRALLDRCTGIVLIGLGVRVALTD